MYISLRYLFVSVLLASQLINVQAEVQNNNEPSRQEVRQAIEDQKSEKTLLNLEDQELVAREQREVPFAYMPKAVQRVLEHIRANSQNKDSKINQVCENYIEKGLNVLPYELALEVVKESAAVADQLNQESLVELESYRQALANKDAHITVEVKEDSVTRRRGCTTYCTLLVRCLTACNLNVPGVATVGRLNLLRGLALPDGTLITGATSIIDLVADGATTGGTATGGLSTVLAPEALRMVRGVVDPGTFLGLAFTTPPTIISGAGFEVVGTTLTLAGIALPIPAVRVNYTTPFADRPAVVVTAGSDAGIVAAGTILGALAITDDSATGFTVYAVDPTIGDITGLSTLQFHVAGARAAA